MKHNQFYDELLDLMSAERRAIAYGRLHYEPTEYYRNLAALFKFSTVYKQSIAEDVQYDSVDEAIDFWFAVTHGVFDPKEADPIKLDSLKNKAFCSVQPTHYNMCVCLHTSVFIDSWMCTHSISALILSVTMNADN